VLKVVEEESESNAHAPAAVGGSLLDEIVRDGARQMLAVALQAEVAVYVEDHAGRTLITGAGFGVLATESVDAMLCQDRPPAARVRVDALPSGATEQGAVGEVLAATIVGALPEGGRRYQGGQLVRSRLGSDPERLTLPDGSQVSTTAVPFGELLAAQRTSGAPDAVSASSLLPAGAIARVVLPLASAVLSIGPLRDLAQRRLAQVRTKARPRPTEPLGRAPASSGPTGRSGKAGCAPATPRTSPSPPPPSSPPDSPPGTAAPARTPPPPPSAQTSP